MLETLLKSVFGSKHERDLIRVRPIVAETMDAVRAGVGLT